eukprot:g1761.t1
MKRFAGDMSKWTRQQLIEHVKSLEKRLQVATARSSEQANAAEKLPKRRKFVDARRAGDSRSMKPKRGKEKGRVKKKSFDMSLYRQRHIALVVSYRGEGYHGFAYQNQETSTVKTTESELFKALKKTCLISDIDSCEYSRCGRTDKDVSGMGQVVALNVRSKLRDGVVFCPTSSETEKSDDAQQDYLFPIRVRSDFLGERLEAMIQISQNTTLSELLDISDSALGIASVDVKAVVVDGDGRRLNDREPVREQLVGASAVDESSKSEVGEISVEEKTSDGMDMTTTTLTLVPKDVKAASIESEHDYVAMLNRVLPSDIRVIGWSPVRRDFDARFSCKGRTYRYFFPKRDLDVARMRDAAARLVGMHDFRNFCKMDAVNVSNFVRQILSCRIFETGAFDVADRKSADANASPSERLSDRSILAFEVRGRGFLYHQVRCMIAVLLMVGEKNEDPEVVDWLLKTSEVQSKPLYRLAPGYPLLFFDCEFDGVRFYRSERATQGLRENLETRWCKASVEMATIQTLLQSVSDTSSSSSASARGTNFGRKHDFSEKRNLSKAFVPLRHRKREKTYEERVKGFKSSRKVRYEMNKALRDARDKK